MAAHELGIEQIGIKDIDGYGHIWYGHYVKYFERAFREFLGQEARSHVVEALKYAKSVPWGAVGSRIETYVVEQDSKMDCVLFQRWIVSEADAPITPENVYSLAIMHVSGVSKALTPSPSSLKLQGGPQLALSMRSLRGGCVNGVQVSTVEGVSRRTARLFSDMLGEGHRLSLTDVMDLFEQGRSDMVGGQEGLKKFKDSNRSLVVARTDSLRRPDVSLEGKTHLEIVTVLRRIHLERRCFDFHSTISCGSVEVASGYMMLCCIDSTLNSLASVEPVVVDSWRRNMSAT